MEEISGEIKASADEKEIEKRKSKLSKFFFGWVKDNYDKIFIAIIVLAFIIRLLIFFKTMNQPFWWDEADYLSAAKKWAGINPSLVDIWYYRRGFLWPLIGALFFKIGFGEIGMRFLEVLFSTGIVAVSYFIIAKMFNKKLALFTSVGLTFSWIILFFTGRVLTDIPSAFFILLSLLLFWKGYVLKEGNKFLYLFGLVFALAILTRMQSFMLAPPFLIYIFLKEKFKMFKNKSLWITLGIFVLLLVPQFVLYAQHYGNPLTDLAAHYFGIGSSTNQLVEGEARGFSMATFNYLKDLPYMLSTPIFILFLLGVFYFFADLFLGIDKLFKSDLLQNKLFIIYWILSLFLIMGYIGSVSYVEQRYITAGLPFLFLIAISPLLLIENLLTKHFHLNKKIIALILFAVLILALVPNFLLENQLAGSKLTSYAEIKDAGLWIKENSNQSDLVMTQSRPQIVYYSERAVQKGELDMFKNESYFEEVTQELKPRYLVLSLYEQSPDWVYSYADSHQNKLVPVKAFVKNQQTTVIVYEFKYS
jgi:4-amino-4-deoxy-L-arabinose transferase-like glycosyltransferase